MLRRCTSVTAGAAALSLALAPRFTLFTPKAISIIPVTSFRFSATTTPSSSSSPPSLQISQHLRSLSASPDFAAMQTIANADSFAKPRVVNYVKRFTPAVQSAATMSTSKVGDWFRCEMTVPIFVVVDEDQALASSSRPSSPSLSAPLQPQRVALAVGFAKSERDAEALCAMHAERIIDNSGAELFSLAAMQSRHAQAAADEGRWARFPKTTAAAAAANKKAAAAAAKLRAAQNEQVKQKMENPEDPPPMILSASIASKPKKQTSPTYPFDGQRTILSL